MRRLLSGVDDGPRRRRIALIVIVALVVIDVVLIALALSAGRGTQQDAAPLPSTSLDSTPAPSEEPAPSSEPQEPATPPTPAATRLIAVGGGGVLWRADVGSCETGGGSVEVSQDAGATWAPVALPEPALTSVRTIVTGPAAAQASVVYADDTCALAAQRTFDAGGGWQQNVEVLGVTSYVTPQGALVLAGVETAAPCAEPRMARGPSAVLCADGLYVGGAAGWSQPVAGVVAVAPYDEQRVVAASVGDAECAGVAVSFVGLADGSRSLIACAEVESVGDVAVGAGGTTAWVWSGDETVSVSLA